VALTGIDADFVASDDQAAVAFAFARAGASAAALAGAAQTEFACSALLDRAEQAMVALGGTPTTPAAASLWDSGGRGYMAGLFRSTGAIDTRKTTIANAYALAALYKVALVRVGPEANHGKPLRDLLLTGTPANTSLFSVLPDQTAYLDATSKTFDFPDDGGLGVARAYSTKATLAVCEALSELWPNP
jgi:hypothetical protein